MSSVPPGILCVRALSTVRGSGCAEGSGRYSSAPNLSGLGLGLWALNTWVLNTAQPGVLTPPTLSTHYFDTPWSCSTCKQHDPRGRQRERASGHEHASRNGACACAPPTPTAAASTCISPAACQRRGARLLCMTSGCTGAEAWAAMGLTPRLHAISCSFSAES
jgi:hypothetical protein